MPSRGVEIQQTTPQVTTMTPQMMETFKKSLRKDRWNKLDLGDKANYEHENVISRWAAERNKWVNVSDRGVLTCVLQRPSRLGQGEEDVRGGIPSGPIPENETEPTRLAVRRTMKQLSGPYNAFD